MSQFRLLSIDPGGTTGLCIAYKHATDTIRVMPWQERITHGGLFELLAASDLTDVVYETFEYRRGTRGNVNLEAKELIGVIKLWQQTNTHVNVYAQSPMTGKAFYSNDMLKKHGVYLRGRVHAMDATRHALHWLTFGSGFRYIEKVTNPEYVLGRRDAED